MLQQTTVNTVIPYFIQWLKNWPTLTDLAKASEDEVLKAWQGLGYYSRARNLWKLAQLVEKLPLEMDALRKLPGIGPYTSAAIAAIAFDHPTIPVDGNIHRVFSRIWALGMDKETLMKTFHFVPELISPNEFAQALMDLGATLCRPQNPQCSLCPVQKHCLAFQKNQLDLYPAKIAKKPLSQLYAHAFVIKTNEEQILFRRRPSKGLLANLMEVPTTPWRDITWSENEALNHYPFENSLSFCGQVHHTFTHLRLELKVFQTCLPKPVELTDHFWATPHEVALPTLMRKVLKVCTT